MSNEPFDAILHWTERSARNSPASQPAQPWRAWRRVSGIVCGKRNSVGEYVIGQAKAEPCPSAEVRFDITNHPARIAVIEQLKGHAGWLTLQQLQIDSFEREEYLLFSAFDDDGPSLDQETAKRLFACDGQVHAKSDPIFQEAGSFLEGSIQPAPLTEEPCPEEK